MELVCNLTFKGVKELKHQKGRKGLEYVWFDEEGKPDSFYDWPFAKEPHQVLQLLHIFQGRVTHQLQL